MQLKYEEYMQEEEDQKKSRRKNFSEYLITVIRVRQRKV